MTDQAVANAVEPSEAPEDTNRVHESPLDKRDKSSSSEKPVTQDGEGAEPSVEFKPDYRFWVILATFSGLVFLVTLENTIIGTALPSIVRDLNIGSNYIWVAHIQMLAGTALMPLVAQLANIFGRRWVTLCVTVFFILGSALCGAATNEAMMLAGRALQGIASQNSILLVEMVIADLVPLRERSKYIGMTLGLASVAIICGPILSGFIVDNTTWRWVSS
jgi:MFS family permease